MYFVKNIHSDSASLKWNLKFCICNKPTDETDASCSRITLWEQSSKNTYRKMPHHSLLSAMSVSGRPLSTTHWWSQERNQSLQRWFGLKIWCIKLMEGGRDPLGQRSLDWSASYPKNNWSPSDRACNPKAFCSSEKRINIIPFQPCKWSKYSVKGNGNAMWSRIKDLCCSFMSLSGWFFFSIFLPSLFTFWNSRNCAWWREQGPWGLMYLS